MSLTEGALARVMRGEDFTDLVSLVVQVLEAEPIPNDRFSLLVSDGAYRTYNSMLDPQLNHLIQEKKLENFTIVKIKELICSSHKVTGGKTILFIILTEIEVITPGAEVGRIIGSPVEIPSDVSAPLPPSNQNKDPNVGAVKRPAETSSVAPPPAKVPANNSNRGEYYSAIATVSYFTKDKSLYKACPNQVDGRDCNKKMQENGDGTYRCEKCSTNLTNYKWRLILSMNIGDYSEGIWSTCFQETAEKMLGMSSEEVGNLSEQNEERFNAVFAEASFKTYAFRMRAKADTYNDETRVKHTVVGIEDVDYIAMNKMMIKEIEAMGGLVPDSVNRAQYA